MKAEDITVILADKLNELYRERLHSAGVYEILIAQVTVTVGLMKAVYAKGGCTARELDTLVDVIGDIVDELISASGAERAPKSVKPPVLN